MADCSGSSQVSCLLNSQGSDLFPAEMKQCMDDPDIQDVINSVQSQDPFLHAQNEESYFVNLNSQPAGMEMFSETVLVQQAPMPSPTCAMLCTEEYPGPYEFEVQMNGENSGKNWLFSYELNKLFINISTIIHLSFKCNSYPPGLYVRAIPVYCENEYFQHPVERCLHHRSMKNKHNDGIPENLLEHVIIIEHPQSIYDYNEESRRRSVRLLLESPQAGSDCVTMAFKFMCKNSCISGMNRRPTEVIFTLENYEAVVYGRQKMKVRICSCPKRDKTKEEAVELKDKDPKSIPRGKRLMQPESDPESHPQKQRKTVEMYQIPVADLEAYLDSLDFTNSRLKRKLRIEQRAPTEKENQLLRRYEQELKTHEQRLS